MNDDQEIGKLIFWVIFVPTLVVLCLGIKGCINQYF